ncbi:MAG: ABC transporter permease [Propionibacteriaceae bacterium]|jgi:peptide/nickel transport system permease protein|nr:ABC transporter permease [Propionibacteriaceae bacterium]
MSPSAVLQNRWVRFAFRRAGRLVVSLWVVVTAAFFMIHLIPGDPVRGALGISAAPEIVAAQREALGLNRPLWDQYRRFISGLFTGDLGNSILKRQPVWETIAVRLPATVSLAVPAFLLALLVAVPLGVAMAVITRNGRARRAELGFVGTSVVLGTIPDFLYGCLFIALFGISLKWLPVAGRRGVSSYILPVVSLAIGAIAILARIVRVEVLAVLNTDYVRTARAKRLPAWQIYLKHAVPNALTATLTLSGMLLATMCVSTVFVENVFAWPGLGQTIVTAITSKDFPVAQAVILVYGAGVIIINTVVDLILALLDPRSAVSEG